MEEQSIIVQIMMLESLIEKLKGFSVEIDYHLATQPDKILKDSVSMGFPKEIAKRYTEGYLEKNFEDAKSVVSDVLRLHIPYLEGKIDHLRSILNR